MDRADQIYFCSLKWIRNERTGENARKMDHSAGDMKTEDIRDLVAPPQVAIGKLIGRIAAYIHRHNRYPRLSEQPADFMPNVAASACYQRSFMVGRRRIHVMLSGRT